MAIGLPTAQGSSNGPAALRRVWFLVQGQSTTNEPRGTVAACFISVHQTRSRVQYTPPLSGLAPIFTINSTGKARPPLLRAGYWRTSCLRTDVLQDDLLFGVRALSNDVDTQQQRAGTSSIQCACIVSWREQTLYGAQLEALAGQIVALIQLGCPPASCRTPPVPTVQLVPAVPGWCTWPGVLTVPAIKPGRNSVVPV